jgi:3-alpha domain-containing YiiM-like protein
LRCGPGRSNHFHDTASASKRARECGFFRDIRYHSGHLHKPPLSDPNWPGSSGRQPALDRYGSRAHWRAITQPNLAISRHASPRGGFLLHAPTGRHSLDSPASGMVNHEITDIVNLYSVDSQNQALLRRATESPALPQSWKDYFRKRLGDADA